MHVCVYVYVRVFPYARGEPGRESERALTWEEEEAAWKRSLKLRERKAVSVRTGRCNREEWRSEVMMAAAAAVAGA